MNFEPTFVIAEAGVNHNGSVDMAMELIAVAAASGADAVKFQTFKAENLVTAGAPKAAYQEQTTAKDESQLEMLRRLELSPDVHRKLIKECNHRGIAFLSTPFDLESLEFLVFALDLPVLKLSSGELTNGPLLLQAARSGRSVILSTGLGTLDEVRAALGVLAFGYCDDGSPSNQAFKSAYESEKGQAALQAKVRILHCTSEYPAPFSDVNLRAMATMRDAFGLPVGLSDHSEGIAVPIAATALGACVIEKHFTLNRDLPGPDHKASIEPDSLCRMVEGIRQIEVALGHGRKEPAEAERHNLHVVRKSLVAERDIPAGASITADALGIKRPGTGLSPMRFWDIVDHPAQRAYRSGDIIDE